MTIFLIQNMAPLMFAALVLFLLLGYPVAFALAANGLAFGLLGIELGLLTPHLLQALPERIFGIMRNDTLLAIPFFTFMGLILERSGMAEDLLDTIGQLFGPLRGARFPNEVWLTPEDLVAVATTRSPYLVGTERERVDLIGAVRRLAAEAGLSGRFPMPYLTRVRAATRS